MTMESGRVMNASMKSPRNDMNWLNSFIECNESLAAIIQEIIYNTDSPTTFACLYTPTKDAFLINGDSLDRATIVRLLTQKLCAAEHTKYCD